MNPQEIIADVFEHLRGMWRYRWLAAGIAWLVSIVGWLYVYSMPDVFQASTKVFVDTNSLLRPLMAGLTAEQNPLDEVQLVSTAVLSRPNLEEVANETDLTLRARTPEQMEALITGLQQRIRIRGGRDNIFTITYEDTSREKSVDVVAAVLDTFVENAIGNQGNDADITEGALASEIRTHEDRLRQADAALAAFKRANVGYMPGDAGDYYQQLQAAIEALNRTQEQVRLAGERRAELVRQLEGEAPVFGIMTAPGGPTAAGCSQRAQIATLRDQLSALRVDFTERHPRIVTLEETITALEQECAATQETARAAGLTAPQAPPAPLETNAVYESLRIQLSSTEVELATLRAELAARQDAEQRLRRDVDKIVQVETDLKQLNRDYEVVQNRHEELLRRWEDLQAKKRLDPVTDQVQFRRIEPPFARAEPVGPNRLLLIGALFLFAIGTSVAVAFGLNQVYPTLFTVRGLRRAVSLPVLGSIRLILTPKIVAKRRVEAVAWAATYTALVAGTVFAIAFATPASALLRRVLEGLSS